MAALSLQPGGWVIPSGTIVKSSDAGRALESQAGFSEPQSFLFVLTGDPGSLPPSVPHLTAAGPVPRGPQSGGATVKAYGSEV